jgi:geranylgeranyl transferase type-2 subunit beta
MSGLPTRRAWIGRALLSASALAAGRGVARCASWRDDDPGDRAFEFVVRCRRDDGGYAPSPDPDYRGESDTKLSDLAAVTYAAVLARTLGKPLPHADRSIAFLRRHQRPDGRFVNLAGEMDPKSDLAILYNTTQGVVALRALGAKPEVDPSPILARFFDGEAYAKLPWYTTSFFPLLYAALGVPFPESYRRALAGHMERGQAADGYVGDHVAATFHMAHFYRLVGRPTPRADEMVARVLRDQKPTGGWDIKEPDWDVHACYDAVFILRQLGGDRPEVRRAIDRAAGWALSCRNEDGGFGHFPGRHSDMDAVYFQLGTLIQAGRVSGVDRSLTEADRRVLGWGHAMQPVRAE